MSSDYSSPHREASSLAHFVDAQQPVLATVMAELRAGTKRTHWMWFIFPQLAGLGRSGMAQRFAIKDAAMAVDYLNHPVLGPRLVDACRTLLALPGTTTAHAVFGDPDTMKLRSSLTLFASVRSADPVFQACLDRYFAGEADASTLALLQGDA